MEEVMEKNEVLPKGWETVQLGDVLEDVIGGGTPSRDVARYWNGDIPWITVKDMRSRRPEVIQEHITKAGVEECATNIIPADTVITATRVGLGKVVRVPYPAAINQDLKALIVGPKLDKSYLEWWILANADYIDSIGSGTTVKGIRLNQLKELELPLAPLPEQRRIVSAIETQLGRLDAAVARLHAAKAKLKRYKQAVLNELVHPQENVESQLLGDIVEKVQVGPFGSQLHKADYVSGGVPLINPQHISEQVITPDMNLTVSSKKFRELPNYHLRKGDVIVGRRGEMGRCAVITENEDGWFCGTGSLYIRPSKALDPRYLACFLASPTSVAYLQGASIGTTMSNLNKGILLDMPIDLPPLSEQRRLVARIEQATAGANEMEATLDAQLLQSTRLRQAVLKRAFEGRLG